MMFTTHAVVGAALGVAAGEPLYGFLGGFASHHLLDMAPHFDQGSFRTKKEGARYLGRSAERIEERFGGRDWAILFADWAVSAVLFAALSWLLPFELLLPALAGAFGGLISDVADSSPLWSKKLRANIGALAAFHNFHSFFHWTVSMRRFWLGIATQVLSIGLALLFLLDL